MVNGCDWDSIAEFADRYRAARAAQNARPGPEGATAARRAQIAFARELIAQGWQPEEATFRAVLDIVSLLPFPSAPPDDMIAASDQPG
jgi:hypothetical protein